MDIIGTDAQTFTTKISEGEMQVFEVCLAYALDTLSTSRLEDMTGYGKDDLEAIWQKLYTTIVNHCDPDRLPERYRGNLGQE